METIHNGFINKNFNDSFKDCTLNDFDLGTTRVFKGVKPMWQQLGFGDVSSDNPESLTYWKNIIPKNYNFFDVDGVEIKETIADSDVGVSKGNKLPRNSYFEITVNENIAQDWKGVFPNRPYYPALPRIDRYGVFTDIVDEEIFFGSKKSWNEDDENAPITNDFIEDESVLFNLTFDGNTTNDIYDLVGNSNIKYVKDFQVTLDSNNRVVTNVPKSPDSVTTKKSEQAF